VREMYASIGLFPIAEWPAEQRSTLLLPVGGSDARILECTRADLFDRRSEGLDPIGSTYRAFDSWASLLGHITAVNVDGQVVEARQA